MSSKDAHLYGAPRPKKKSTAPPSSLDFSSALGSLIAASSSSTSAKPSALPPRDKAPKEDLFKKSSSRKRPRDDPHGPRRPLVSAPLEDDEYQRSKRKMEEKSRLYAALKRGDVEDEHERYGVDFDRKWAEKHPEQQHSDQEDTSDDDDDGEPAEDALVEYIDDLGRTRTGTRRDARMAEMARTGDIRTGTAGHRPARPDGLIYGETIQAEAFDPDLAAMQKMTSLAAGRDNPETDDTLAQHYDADWEIRQKGTGFFKFSKDEGLRQEQMADMERVTAETARTRGDKVDEDQARREARRLELEARRLEVAERKKKRRADAFLQELGDEMARMVPESGAARPEQQ